MFGIAGWTRQHRLLAFFGLTYAVSWWPWPFYALGLSPTPFFACGPLVAALVVIGIAEGGAGYREWCARMVRWRVGWRWWAVALGTPPAVLALAAAVNVAGWEAPAPSLTRLVWPELALVFALRFVNPLDGPLGEEPGWRGYAQPRLEAEWSPLAAVAILAVAAAGWHLPLVAAGMLAPIGLLVTFVITIGYGWLFRRTGGSALLPLVFHVAQGTVSYAALGFTGADAARMDWLTGGMWAALAVTVVLLDRAAWRPAPAAVDERGVADSRS